jgi:hypothetical protein
MSMHAGEESDEGIVPMKRSNNGSLLPAEIVEGRASPKENGGQATAVRTPSRGTASSRLEAVRQTAQLKRDVRFSVLLSNLYLHYVLDLWFERVVKCRLRGEARLVRYIDDFVLCFQYRSDALRVEDALRHRLGKFGLTLEPTKTKLVEFGRFAQRHAGKRGGRKRPETIYFLGLTLYCTRNRRGNFKVGMRTEKSRLRRSLLSLQELMRQIRHRQIGEQVSEINTALRGHYAYYGVAGNIRALFKVYRTVERYWCKMLRSRSRAGSRLTWEAFNQIKQRIPLLRPKLRLPYRELQALAVL